MSASTLMRCGFRSTAGRGALWATCIPRASDGASDLCL